MFRALVICGILSTVCGALPSGWTPCSKSAPDHNECIKKNLETVLQSLKTGIPEYGIPPVEPFAIKHIDISVSQGFKMFMDNGHVSGLTDSKVTKVESTPWKKLKVNIEIPKIEYNFNYSCAGDIFNMKINSSGVGHIRSDDVEQDLDITFAEFQKDGKRYLKADDIAITETIKNSVAEYHPHGKDSTYISTLNKIINDNWKEILDEQQKMGNPSVKKFMMSFINSVLEKIPLDNFDMA